MAIELSESSAPAGRPRNAFYRTLHLQVLAAIILGVLVGALFPYFGASLKPLGDAFIKLIKMIIAPVIFLTVVVGIASVDDLKKLGRVGIKALFYFEGVTTFALLFGLIMVKVFQPGAGINADPSTLDASAVAAYAKAGQAQSAVDYLMHIIPDTVGGAFATGEILQVLFFAILFGLSLMALGKLAAPIVHALDDLSKVFFAMVDIIMYTAPLGAFGAMAFTIGKFGIATLLPLGEVMLCTLVACAIFVFLVLAIIMRLTVGMSIWKLLKYIKEEIFIVMGTSSSESVLPQIMLKLERLGCSKPVVGLVVPAGYSFNLDGTSIYLTIAAFFVVQATNTHLSVGQQITMLAVLMLTSKGAAGVSGSGFIILAATLASLRTVPVAGITLLLGIDRFMSGMRSLTNLIGNSVATIVIARWEGELDTAKAADLFNQAPALGKAAVAD